MIVGASPIASTGASPARRVIILGIDGMDPRLLERFVAEGGMPHFARLMAEGDYRPLQTTMPPLSPVAWSTFITGMDPAGHGIFDFVHRDPTTLLPKLSMAEARDPEKSISLGNVVIPLASGEVELLRKGRAFWQILDEAGVRSMIFRMPANFPPAPTRSRSLSGMGTPDILGTPGTFTLYTDAPPANAAKITGGTVQRVAVADNQVRARLVGPKNAFRRVERPRRPGRPATEPPQYDKPDLTIDFAVYLDPEASVAKFEIQDQEFILQEKEWSPWVPVRFTALPLLAHVSAVGRFYLQEVRPRFRLYLSPLQISVADPALPITTPADWCEDLHAALGYFYTQELPEDTKALTHGVFSPLEFWEQAQFVYREQRAALDFVLGQFEAGLLFFYFSSVDQSSHMLWAADDPAHPAHDPTLKGKLRELYAAMDEALGRVVEAVDDRTTLILMSDHGFAPFYWGVNLNSWLVEKGYIRLRNPARQEQYPLFQNVDWSRSTAYALGLNGLYVNLRGREKDGIVQPGAEYEALLDRLAADLLAMRDDRTGRSPVSLVVRTRRDMTGPYAQEGPDLIVGYDWGYRSSWESPLGEFPRRLFVDNTEAWSGDHSMDHRHVPGVLLSNRRITKPEPALYDLTVAVLDEFGVPPGPGMIGQDCLGESFVGRP